MGLGMQVNQTNKMPNTYSNGFYKNNKRLSSPMISGGQKFGVTQKLKFNKEIQRGRGDNNNNIINNNNQFIQNNNYININYYPQPNESK